MRLEVVSVAAVAAVAATAAYIRRLRAELAAAKRDNGEFVAAALRDVECGFGNTAPNKICQILFIQNKKTCQKEKPEKPRY